MSFRTARSIVALAVAGSITLPAPFSLPASAEDIRLLPPVLGASQRQASDWRSGLGLSGYDPVGALLDKALRPGNPRYEALGAGLAWRFTSAANREAFLRDPDAFLPRIGGYDALQAASGRIVSTDPAIFAERDGRLYVFRTAENRERFLRDGEAASAAEAAWPRLRESLVGG